MAEIGWASPNREYPRGRRRWNRHCSPRSAAAVASLPTGRGPRLASSERGIGDFPSETGSASTGQASFCCSSVSRTQLDGSFHRQWEARPPWSGPGVADHPYAGPWARRRPQRLHWRCWCSSERRRRGAATARSGRSSPHVRLPKRATGRSACRDPLSASTSRNRRRVRDRLPMFDRSGHRADVTPKGVEEPCSRRPAQTCLRCRARISSGDPKGPA